MNLRTRTGLWPMLVLFGMLVWSLYSLGSTPENIEGFGEFYIVLLVVNVACLFLFSILIITHAWGLWRDYRRGVQGSRLTAKLVMMIVVVSLVPVIVIYAFSIRFLNRSIDSWFDTQVEQALDNALTLSRHALADHRRLLEQMMLGVARELETDLRDPERVLSVAGAQLGAEEINLFNAQEQLLASGGQGLRSILPAKPDAEMLGALQISRSISDLAPDPNGGLYMRVLVPVLNVNPSEQDRMLFAIFPIDERRAALAANVEVGVGEYRRIAYLRKPLKTTFLTTLSLAFLLSILMAIFVAFFSARKLLQPIAELVKGTLAVASGDYRRTLIFNSSDEMGFLVRSFNTMTSRLEHLRSENESSREQLESQRSYLQAVLGQLSTGVMTIDEKSRLRTANRAAASLLDETLDNYLGCDLAVALGNREGTLFWQLYATIKPHLDARVGEWNTEIEAVGKRGRRVFMCRGARLKNQVDAVYALVFDDITPIISAQRDAAWSEVAKRLAHEIKNPLTPIQLSAERVRRRLMDKLEDDDANLLDRATRTIVQQVDSMKSMVKAFADYANAPEPRFAELSLNQLIVDVAELYQGMDQRLQLNLSLDECLPKLRADAIRMRQLLHNLVKNGIEAQSERECAELWITTEYRESAYAYVQVRDAGPGFPVKMLDRIFEPYVTSKPRGTGLGLAVVKQIVGEHGGTVDAENNPEGGASITVLLPFKPVEKADKGDSA